MTSRYERDTIAVRFAVGRVLVRGPSMAPTLRHGDHLLVVRRRTAKPGRLVVVRLPGQDTLAVKRLSRVVDGGALWVEGDNPFGSTDSRSLGPLPAGALVGVAVARLWPRPRLLG
jgi:nickel-type superoxide dismutase maturation protease